MNGETKQEREKKHLLRGMYILPSLFTAGNIAAGYYSITESFQGLSGDAHHFNYAALAIGFAIPFDAIDGRIARMTHTESDFGKELDSLADVITFGVAPSILAWSWGFKMLPAMQDAILHDRLVEFGAFVCFLFLICGASRLARFNISRDPLPRNPGRAGRKYFVGMPIPAAAGAVAATVHFFSGEPITNPWIAILWLIEVTVVSLLMVSRWRFWSAKEINLTKRHSSRKLVLMTMFMASLVLYSRYELLALALVYTFSGIVARLGYSWQRSRQNAAQRRLEAIEANAAKQ
jgi:CDP-diacylglycerol--serine O-phosphatidyltransferase